MSATRLMPFMGGPGAQLDPKRAEVIHGRAEEVVPKLGRFDLVVVDPPYAFGAKKAEWRVGASVFIALNETAKHSRRADARVEARSGDGRMKRFQPQQRIEFQRDTLAYFRDPHHAGWEQGEYVRDTDQRGWHWVKIESGEKFLVPSRRLRPAEIKNAIYGAADRGRE